MRISITGGPGVGKSVLAAWIYQEMKSRFGSSIELVREWVKTWAWQGIIPESWDRLYMFAKQLRSEDIVLRSGMHIVTDCSLLTAIGYMQYHSAPCCSECIDLLEKFNAEFPSIEVYVERAVPYKREGRYETEQQLARVDALMYNLWMGVQYDKIKFNPVKDGKQDLLEKIIEIMER